MSTDEPLSGTPSSRTGQNDARTTRPMSAAGDAGADEFIASLSGGRYQLVERVGAGSIGQVWRAQDATLQREVAIKTINLATSADPSTEARFRREAIATAGLNHPSIVQIYDSGVDGHSAYIVMEFLHGPNLQSVVTKQGPIDWRAAVPLLAQVAAGLGSAHRLGVVHRDVKPANVVLSSEDLTSTPKLVDFGIAHLADQQGTALTSTMTAIGSAAYMSPEQAAGERVGPNSDMYSFGCLMLTVLTGQPPFPGESPVAVARAQVYDTPPLLRSRLPDAPASLENLIAALLDKRPEARPSATETVAALNAIHGDPDAPGLIEPPHPAGPGADAATVAMSAGALGAAATQTADGQGLTRILPADATAGGTATSGPGATGTMVGPGATGTMVGAAGTGATTVDGAAPSLVPVAGAAATGGGARPPAGPGGGRTGGRNSGRNKRIVLAVVIIAVLAALIVMAWAQGRRSADPAPSQTVTQTQTATASASRTATAAPTSQATADEGYSTGYDNGNYGGATATGNGGNDNGNSNVGNNGTGGASATGGYSEATDTGNGDYNNGGATATSNGGNDNGNGGNDGTTDDSDNNGGQQNAQQGQYVPNNQNNQAQVQSQG